MSTADKGRQQRRRWHHHRPVHHQRSMSRRRTSNDEEDDDSRRLRPFLGKNPGGDKRSDQQLISMFGDGCC
ncbi:hypothetical protein GPALN_003287 [Globodera pallida]|nr:hypothetical protein GPALN_003287 [Globodera pallida]